VKLNILISLKLIIFYTYIPELILFKFILFAGTNIAYTTKDQKLFSFIS